MPIASQQFSLHLSPTYGESEVLPAQRIFSLSVASYDVNAAGKQALAFDPGAPTPPLGPDNIPRTLAQQLGTAPRCTATRTNSFTRLITDH